MIHVLNSFKKLIISICTTVSYIVFKDPQYLIVHRRYSKGDPFGAGISWKDKPNTMSSVSYLVDYDDSPTNSWSFFQDGTPLSREKLVSSLSQVVWCSQQPA